MSDTNVRTLVDLFLEEQAGTTAVDRFARAHGHGEASPLPAPANRWRDLMPASPPGPGQQYAFEVDLDDCSGCKACVVACGRMNGLDEGASFRSVGEVVGTQLPLVRNVTTACHHCVDPGCLTGCPVDAYEKDPVTGVVRHLDDQCIGCQYCTLTCPYEVPRYDRSRGIVRKCDLCHERLAEGEAPACVAACPTQAIAVRVVDVEAAVAAAADPWPLPAPDPALTVPTTRFRTSEDLRGTTVAADAGALRTAHAHPPLAVMLVFTQVAVGTLVLLAAGLPAGTSAVPGAVTALVMAVSALAASILHLGRPLQAWRALLGLRHSWLSREILAFGVFAPAGLLYAAALADVGGTARHAGWLGVGAAATGVAAVGASAKLYAATGRRWWSFPRTMGRFTLTAANGGVALLLAIVTLAGAATGQPVAGDVARLAAGASLLAVVTLGAEVALLHRHAGPADDEIATTARLLVRRLGGLVTLRVAGAVVGGVAPWLAWRMLTVPKTSATAAAVTCLLGAAAVVAGELAERWRFFAASAPRRMPGARP